MGELHCRHAVEVVTPIFAALAASTDRPVRDVLRQVIQASIRAHAIEPALHRVRSEQLPKLDEQPWEAEMSEQASKLIRAFLCNRQDEIGPRHLGVATFLLMRSVESAVHAAVWAIPRELRSGALGRELKMLRHAYLVAGRT